MVDFPPFVLVVVVSVMLIFLRGDDLVEVDVVVTFSTEDRRLLLAERSGVSSRKSADRDASPEEETWFLLNSCGTLLSVKKN